MSKRKTITEMDPKAYQPLLGLDKYISQSPLDKHHWELIKIRISQINGCAYCLDKHTHDSAALGESQQRINVLSVWRETSLFSKEEQAILALAEEITRISEHGVSDETYNNAIAILGEPYTAAVIMAAIGMNAWNRVGITTKMEPELAKQAA